MNRYSLDRINSVNRQISFLILCCQFNINNCPIINSSCLICLYRFIISSAQVMMNRIVVLVNGFSKLSSVSHITCYFRQCSTLRKGIRAVVPSDERVAVLFISSLSRFCAVITRICTCRYIRICFKSFVPVLPSDREIARWF